MASYMEIRVPMRNNLVTLEAYQMPPFILSGYISSKGQSLPNESLQEA